VTLLGDILLDDVLLKEQFVCDLDACKGACCVAGDAGAPLEPEEVPILERVYAQVAHLLSDEGKAAIAAQGTALRGEDGTWETPLMRPSGPCAYTVFEGGIAKCGIEIAHRQGLVDFKKPISCHLYPIRVHHTEQFEFLRYDRWQVCSAACANGKKLRVPVLVFLREALVRKYGEAWYGELMEMVSAKAAQRNPKLPSA
jgi:hypothetical protein